VKRAPERRPTRPRKGAGAPAKARARREVPTVAFESADGWRRFLDGQGTASPGAWLVFYKAGARRRGVAYGDALDEALCVGWIDSLVKRRDPDSYLRKFTPRTDPARWSAANLERVRRLLAEGRVTARGRAVLAPRPVPPIAPGHPALPPWLRRLFVAQAPAWANYQALAPSYRRTYLRWVTSAKREETRLRRGVELSFALARGEKLGLK